MKVQARGRCYSLIITLDEKEAEEILAEAQLIHFQSGLYMDRVAVPLVSWLRNTLVQARNSLLIQEFTSDGELEEKGKKK